MSDEFDKNDWLPDEDEPDDSEKSDEKDSFDWLSGESGKPSGKPSETHTGVTGELSWLQEFEQSPDSGTERHEHTGLTGQLSWQGTGSDLEDQLSDMETPSPDQPEAPAEPDWLKSTGEVDAVRLQETETPDWLQQVGDTGFNEKPFEADREPFDSGALPDWMAQSGDLEEESDTEEAPQQDTTPGWLGETFDASETESAPAAEAPEALPDWMGGQSTFEDSQADATTEEAPASEPDWMKSSVFGGSSPNDSDEGAGFADLPPWLAGAIPADLDEPAAEAPPTGEKAAAFSADWLSSSDETFGEDEGSFEADTQPASEPGSDLDASWLSSQTEPPEEEAEPEVSAAPVQEDTGDLQADWLTAADDLFEQGEPEAAPEAEPTGSGEDWLAQAGGWGDEAEAAPAAEVEPTSSGFDDMDFETMFADTEAAPAGDSELPSFDDVFGEEAFASEDEPLPDMDLSAMSLDDVFGEASEPEPAVSEPASTPSDGGMDELFGDDVQSLFGDEAQQPAASTQFDISGLDDLFGEASEPAPVVSEPTSAPSDAGLDELFGDDVESLFGDEDQQPAAEFDDAGLDDLFGEAGEPGATQAETQSDDASLDDLFGDEEEETPAPAASGFNTDYLKNMGVGKTEEAPVDWFAEPEQEQAASPDDNLDWMREVSAADLEAPAGDEAAVPADADFLAELGDVQPAEAAGAGDVDSLLATFDADKIELPATGELDEGKNVEFEELFADENFKALDRPVTKPRAKAPPDIPLSEDAPEWLKNVSMASGEESAAALVRQRKDRPIEDLPDRLQSLHERGLELPGATGDTQGGSTLGGLLPGVIGVLSPAPVEPPPIAEPISSGVNTEQRQRTGILKQLIGAQGISLVSAEPTAKEFDWSEDLPEAEAAAVPVVTPTKRRTGIKIDRLIIGLLLAAAMIVPFFIRAAQVGDLPARTFAAGSLQQRAYDLIEALKPGDKVLVGIEYGPTGAGELDSATLGLLRHILLRGAHPILVGGNPVGMLHAGNVLNALGTDGAYLHQIGRSQGFQANKDYYLIRYLTGGVIGLRALSDDVGSLVRTDIHGDNTGLTIHSLNDFALIVVIGERSEDVRGWTEQIVPLSNAPLVIAAGFGAAPLAEPYVTARANSGLLVGYRDAYTYNIRVDALLYGEEATPTPPPTEVPTLPPTEIPGGATAQAQPTSEGGTAVENATATLPPTRVLPATFTATPTDTPTDTPSPTPTNSPTSTATPTPTPTPTDTFTPSPTPLPIAVVKSAQPVNVRSGAGTRFQPVAVVRPGTQVLVLGQSDDGKWVNIRLDDGKEGWIASNLIEIQASASSVEASPTPEGFEASPTPETSGSNGIGQKLFNKPRTVRQGQEDTPTPEGFEASPTPEGFNSFQATQGVMILTLTAIANGSASGTLTAVAQTVVPQAGNVDATLTAAAQSIPQVGDVDATLTAAAQSIPQAGDAEATLTAIAQTGVPQAGNVDATLTAAAQSIPQAGDAEATLTAAAQTLTALPQNAGVQATLTAAASLTPGSAAATQQPASGGQAVAARPTTIPYRDERWYSMTLGIIVAVVVIAGGNLFNILRRVFRRGRS